MLENLMLNLWRRFSCLVLISTKNSSTFERPNRQTLPWKDRRGRYKVNRITRLLFVSLVPIVPPKQTPATSCQTHTKGSTLQSISAKFHSWTYVHEAYRGTYKQLHTLIMLKCSEENVLPYNPATALTNLENANWLLFCFFQLNSIASICTGTRTCTHTRRHKRTRSRRRPLQPHRPPPP